MSFILDALKKSEIERQRQSMPGLIDVPTSLRRGRLPFWAVLLGCLLAINILVLIFLLIRNGAPAALTAARHDTPLADAKPPAVDEHFSPLSATPVYAPEIPVPPAEASPSKQEAVAAAVAPHAVAQRTAPHSLRRPDPVLTEDAAADNDEVLPTINEVNLTGAQALPELHLDVHVYATNPAERFVFINMRKYKEGNTLQEGPVWKRFGATAWC